MRIKIAVISYNPIFQYSKKKEIIVVSGKKVLILPQTFTRDGHKAREYVSLSDSNWQELLQYADTLDQVIIFAGKKESGALEIIARAVTDFSEKKTVLFFVLCDHDLEEKIALLNDLGISKDQWMWFGDNNERCKEAPILKGYMHDFAETSSP